MNICTPSVKDISLYREIAKNLVNPLEVPREAISNSIDAEAKNISIDIYRNSEGVFCISFTDDGYGMNYSDIESFFNLGDSRKDDRNIGEKGLGTKIFFKSERIIVDTQINNSLRILAVMKEPWRMLSSNKIPTYTVEKVEANNGNNGTKILIEGYKVDNPEKYFNYYTLKDYILWFTAAGSFKNLFATYTELNSKVKNMQIAPRVYINDYIEDIKEEIAGAHQFYPPQENPQEDTNETIYTRSVNYCRHFGPYYRSTNINGEYVSFQLYGTVSGVNCRNAICKLKRGKSLKSRFGVYLAKDFIPFLKKPTLLTDPNYHHFHILVNSQNFELTADRNNLSNEDDPKVKWILNNVRKIINEDILLIAQSTYFKLRRDEENVYYIKEKSESLKKRVQYFAKLKQLDIKNIPIKKVPDNESQVVLLLTALLCNVYTKKYIPLINSIAHYSHQSSTDLICYGRDESILLIEIEYLLSNIFKHEHPYKTFDCIVCWKVDLEINEKRKLVDNIELKLICNSGEWAFKYGTDKIIPIIELSNIITKMEEEKHINVTM